jgi:HlyD family secretion protein
MSPKFLSLLLAAVVVAGCGPRPTTAPAAPVTSVQVSPAHQADIIQALTYTGNVKAQSEVNVLPKQAGRIVSMSGDIGTKVQAGDVLAQIEHTTLDLGLQQAQAQLLTAQARVDTIKAGPRPETVQQAALSVDVAQSRLQNLLNGPRSETVAQATLQLDQAQQRLATITAGNRPETIARAQASLNVAQARLEALKNGARPEVVATLEIAIAQSKNALFAAQVNRDGACGASSNSYQCKAANAQVDAAQSGIDLANANLKSQTAPPTQTDLQQAQAAVNQATSALQLAQKPYTAQDLQTAQDAVAQAEQAVSLASHPFTDEDIRQARDAVDVAQQQLALAKQPYTDQDLASAQAGVAQAQAAADEAQQAIKDTTISAPIAGVITQKLVDVGAMAAPGQPIVAIATSGLKVAISAEETQIANLKLGQPASIAGPALGDQVIPAKITNISPSGDAKNRTFAVEVTPDQPPSALLPGMFVQVTVNSVEHKGVVAVPTQAIVERSGKFYVYLVDSSNVAHLTAITVGLADANQTEVSGVTAGASVVVQGQDQLTDGDRVTPVGTP